MSELWEPQTKRATKPATRWRNRWRATVSERVWKYEPCQMCGCSDAVKPGDTYECLCAHPTKDIAETWAYLILAEDEEDGIDLDEYLGAFPVDE